MTPAELREYEARFQRALVVFDQAREERNLAVRKALADGMTHAQAAEAVGVSRGRIGQIAMGRG